MIDIRFLNKAIHVPHLHMFNNMRFTLRFDRVQQEKFEDTKGR